MKFSIRTKMLLGFAVVIALLVTVSWLATANMKTMGDKSKEIDQNYLPSILLANDMAKEATNAQRLVLRVISDLSTTDRERLQEEFKTSVDNIEKYKKEYVPKISSDEERRLYNDFLVAWNDYYEHVPAIFESLKKDDYTVTYEMVKQLAEPGRKSRSLLNEIVELKRKASYEATAESIRVYESGRTFIIVISVIALIVAAGAAIGIATIISKPLNRVVQLVSKVAHGDLREQVVVKQKDEVGQLAQSVNGMVGQLRALISQVVEASQNVAASSEQISASTQEIAAGSTSQSSSAQTMNELFIELTRAIEAVADSAEHAAELSDETRVQAQEGGKVVSASVDGMNRLNEQMLLLRGDSEKIEAIIEVIEEIADQTNLLALNAAIEAARAGEQGRGFAVVADEVRKLAERSGSATKQIGTIIKGMQQNTYNSMKALDEAVGLSRETGQALEHIIAKVNESAHQAAEIAAASEEQAAQTVEVRRSIELIASASEQSAAAAEETAASSQMLAKLADELNQSVTTFKI